MEVVDVGVASEGDTLPSHVHAHLPPCKANLRCILSAPDVCTPDHRTKGEPKNTACLDGNPEVVILSDNDTEQRTTTRALSRRGSTNLTEAPKDRTTTKDSEDVLRGETEEHPVQATGYRALGTRHQASCFTGHWAQGTG